METTTPQIVAQLTARDVFIELADTQADLITMTDRAVNAEADREGYRLLSQQLLHALHEVTGERDRLRRRLRERREAERTHETTAFDEADAA